ncbi:biotin/lipoyl-binding protein, partial [Cereibacter changlensis]
MSAVLDWLAAAVAALGFGSEAQVYNGYAEADYVHVAPLTAGRIVSLAADEGDSVAAGQVLVLLETDSQTAALQAAEAAVAVAKANLDNLQTGSRAAEIAVVAASLHRAEADRNLARTTLARSQRLLDQGRVPQAEVDRDRSALESAEAQVDQLSAELEVAQLPARD